MVPLAMTAVWEDREAQAAWGRVHAEPKLQGVEAKCAAVRRGTA
jgi:hypothetical protein